MCGGIDQALGAFQVAVVIDANLGYDIHRVAVADHAVADLDLARL
jgi:hypothetical protein